MSGLENKCICRLAGVQVLEPVLETMYQDNDDKLLVGKTLGKDLRNMSSFRAG